MQKLVFLVLVIAAAVPGAAADPPLVDGVSGAPLAWSDWLAKRGPVAVMVWASWAPGAGDVIANYPTFARASRDAGFHPVLVDVQESLGDGRKALAGSGIQWIHDRHGGFLKLYRVISLPSVVVIAADGQVLQRLKATPESLQTGVPSLNRERFLSTIGRAGVRWSAAVLFPLSFLAAIGIPACGNDPIAASSLEPVMVKPLEAFHPPFQTVVRSGDTIESISRRLAGPDWVAWRDALSAEIDPKKLAPGTEFHGHNLPSGALETVAVVFDRRNEVHLTAGPEGISSRRVERPVSSEVVRLEGIVQSSLFGAMQTAGGGPELAVRVAQIYQWDIDFFRDLRQGDSFVVVVERQEVEGGFFGWGTIYAARFVNRERVLNAIVYPDNDGRLGYFDLEGHPLRKQFLRSPLKFSRVTSRFSMNRFHPVLKRRMPHYGVDYGAPTGTPAHVTADGTVVFAGRKGGGGNMVTVRHTNGYETNYLHLSRFGKGIRRGVRVAQGQVIGHVGSTGLSSGPHLDYRVKLNGRWINPLSISSPPVKPLAEERLQRFLAHALAVLSLIDDKTPPVGARC